MIMESPNSFLIPKAIYSMAEVYRTKGDSLKIDSLHSIILERYPESVYAYQVKKLRGEDVSPEKHDVVALEFAEAESLLQAGQSAEALHRFKTIAKTQKSDLAPKASYSVGWIYENVIVDTDSATAWYRQLLKEYPSSVYAATAQPKVAVKDNPDDLSKYIKIKEIQAVPKPPKPNFRKPGSSNEEEQSQQGKNDPRNIRNRDREEEDTGDEEGEEEPESDEAPEPDDDGGDVL
jgi:tetratricopeptide (TPR) repeat protein